MSRKRILLGSQTLSSGTIAKAYMVMENGKVHHYTTDFLPEPKYRTIEAFLKDSAEFDSNHNHAFRLAVRKRQREILGEADPYQGDLTDEISLP